ncbi:MAG: polysaccharide biosynthesis C-terminal domain-containing protein, partial [Armatimonadetes bacterium]|nr:polysaccharide biosynthesis C-terminal domain-containing protein [Armatimonadota bacterium]
PLLIHALYGARYDGAAVSFHWLVIAGVPMSLFSLCKDVLVSRGQAALNTRVQCLGAVVTLLCCSLLIKSFGLVGAGVASFLAYSIVAGVALICVSRSTGVPLRSMMIPKTNDIAGLRSRLMKGKGLAAEA